MNSECSICFEIVRSNETQKPLVTRCGHLFHDSCINNCLQHQSYGKCPQCNQSITSSELIRLYINEPENSVRAKDELIEQLKNQLHELNEKAQLQYDLIGSLNRQIVVEKELRSRGKIGDSSLSKTSNSTLQSPQRIVAPSKLHVQKREHLKNIKGPVSNPSSRSSGKPLAQGFAFGPNPQTVLESNSETTFGTSCSTTFGSNKLWGNKSETFGKPLFNFGDCENLGAWRLSKTTDKSSAFTASNQPVNLFAFGSSAINTTFGNLNQTSLKFPSNDCSDGRTQTQLSTKSAAQNTNIFAPITAFSTTKSTFNSVSSTKGQRRGSIILNRSFASQRNADAAMDTASSSPASLFTEVAESLRISVRMDNVGSVADPGEVVNKIIPEKENSQSM